ncbi:MAG: hypothetical protein IPK37_07515 [Austwickia sp.]|nr:MAG: hypothetical protein IPK37_07515 [Austwickia sp.]
MPRREQAEAAWAEAEHRVVPQQALCGRGQRGGGGAPGESHQSRRPAGGTARELLRQAGSGALGDHQQVTVDGLAGPEPHLYPGVGLGVARTHRAHPQALAQARGQQPPQRDPIDVQGLSLALVPGAQQQPAPVVADRQRDPRGGDRAAGQLPHEGRRQELRQRGESGRSEVQLVAARRGHVRVALQDGDRYAVPQQALGQREPADAAAGDEHHHAS